MTEKVVIQLKKLRHITAIEFGITALQHDIWTGVFAIATCLCQPMDRVYYCLALTDIKVYRLLCLQERLNIFRCSVDVEPILKFVPKLLKATVTFITYFRLSVSLPTLNNLCPFRQIFVKFDIALVWKICLRNSSLIGIWKEI
jgi:hypothetical protein